MHAHAQLCMHMHNYARTLSKSTQMYANARMRAHANICTHTQQTHAKTRKRMPTHACARALAGTNRHVNEHVHEYNLVVALYCVYLLRAVWYCKWAMLEYQQAEKYSTERTTENSPDPPFWIKSLMYRSLYDVVRAIEQRNFRRCRYAVCCCHYDVPVQERNRTHIKSIQCV